MINLVVVQGSVRPNNNTAKAIALAVQEAEKISGITIQVIDPTLMALSLPGRGETDDAHIMQRALEHADGVILATPEYHGSYSSVMKLMIDNMGFPSRLSGKPVALLGVAAGRIGAIKALEHLRSVASHVGAIVLPGPVSVASVNKMFDDKGEVLDDNVRALVSNMVIGLIDYIRNTTCPNAALESFAREVATVK